MVKRFVLFVCECYYPGGGWDDFDSYHDTLEGAQLAAKTKRGPYNDTHVVDLTTGEIFR